VVLSLPGIIESQYDGTIKDFSFFFNPVFSTQRQIISPDR
jgi:hypothetical protein